MKSKRPSAIFAKMRVHWIRTTSALLLVVLSTGYATSGTWADGALVTAALANPMSLFAARSPGSRTAGALAQTKPAYARPTSPERETVPPVPGERVLSKVRSAPPPAPVAPGADVPARASAGVPALAVPVEPGAILPAPVSDSVPGSTGGFIGYIGGGSTGGTGETGGTGAAGDTGGTGDTGGAGHDGADHQPHGTPIPIAGSGLAALALLLSGYLVMKRRRLIA